MPNDRSSVLLDTNILIRFVTPKDPLHTVTVDALVNLVTTNAALFICPQAMGELRHVATRQEAASGLGWTSERTATVMDALEKEFSLTAEPQTVYGSWRRIVETVGATGRAIERETQID